MKGWRYICGDIYFLEVLADFCDGIYRFCCLNDWQLTIDVIHRITTLLISEQNMDRVRAAPGGGSRLPGMDPLDPYSEGERRVEGWKAGASVGEAMVRPLRPARGWRHGTWESGDQ